MNAKAWAVLGCCLLLLIAAECHKKGKPPKSTGKKAAKEPRGGELKPLQAAGRLPAQALPRHQPTAQPPVKAAGPPVLLRVLGPGRFQAVAEALALRAGDTLELRCRGRAVRWSHPAHLEDEERPRLRIKHFEKYSQMQVVNATAADTGQYSCWSFQCLDTRCQDGEDRTGKTFIFFADPQELFIPTENYYEVLQLRANRPTLLPCQVTSPLARVTLHREFPPEEVPVDGVNISYDVQRGFMIHRSQPSYAGSLFCIASLDGVRQISTKYMLIYINYPSSPPKPTVRASATAVQPGESFNVTCTVLGEPEASITFTWAYPRQQLGRPPYVRERAALRRQGGQVRQEAESTLYVDEARAGTQGLYTCQAQTLEGAGSTSTRVRVLPAPAGA
ncbi:platelet-derived growth factor receptor-like protein [Apteryx mantelli]|uniref:Platelet-derived growth factor receptor-like protein n=1 Tax=Apteryx mantelli TaxID=2696672 RepID=A0ABM4F894_9AVES